MYSPALPKEQGGRDFQPKPWHTGSVNTGKFPGPVFFLWTRVGNCPHLWSARKAGGTMNLGLPGTLQSSPQLPVLS